MQAYVFEKETFGLINATYNAKVVIADQSGQPVLIDLYKWITFAPLQRKFDFFAT